MSLTASLTRPVLQSCGGKRAASSVWQFTAKRSLWSGHGARTTTTSSSLLSSVGSSSRIGHASPFASAFKGKASQQARTVAALTDGQMITRPDNAEKWKRIAATSAAILGGVGALTWFNNRETRDGLTPFEASYLNKTFSYVGVGLGITAASAFALHRSGVSYRIMRANPWVVIGGSLVATVGCMYMAYSTSPASTGAKHFWWSAFNVAQSATLSPLLYVIHLPSRMREYTDVTGTASSSLPCWPERAYTRWD